MSNVKSDEKFIDTSNDLLSEYIFDYGKSRPNRFAANTSPGEPMSGLRGHIETIGQKLAAFTRDRDLTSAKVADLNPTIERLHTSKLLETGTIIIGSVLDSVGDPDSETEWITLAAIKVPGGVGTASTYVDWVDGEARSGSHDFTPFERCKPVIQARLLPCIEGLVNDLLSTVDRSTRSA